MGEAINSDDLRRIYNDAARRYDLQHALLTLHSDERGRRMVVELGVRERDRVLDAGTGLTGLLAARKVGPDGHVTV